MKNENKRRGKKEKKKQKNLRKCNAFFISKAKVVHKLRKDLSGDWDSFSLWELKRVAGINHFLNWA